ncbi:DUF58 domain-containing protein [Marinobacterium zhoushanense]|uniref:DUF58 domain-containing protein n=1 Tax=Marinobacterium zhoushanense TaxID=1679163 RepID=UPI00166717AE|nr:DUF58 domain-containing protein [Marinobacterium zhoushanense]
MSWAEVFGIGRLSRLLRNWSLRRFPRRRTVRLTQNRIYILPTAAGVGFIFLLLMLLLLAINYESNLAYGLTFLLVSLFILSIIQTYANLAGLEVTALRGHACYAGEHAGFTVELRAAKGRDHEQLVLSWEQGTPLTLDLTDQRVAQIELACAAPRRGWLYPGPLKLETHFPLGLFRAWTWLDTGLRALVYPKPLPCRAPESGGGDGAMESRRTRAQGFEDFNGFSRYENGVSLHQVAWKVYARGQGLHVKQYAGAASDEVWLDWDRWPAVSEEERLSGICYWALELTQREQPYGVRIPGVSLAPASGEAHRLRVMRELALFGQGA